MFINLCFGATSGSKISIFFKKSNRCPSEQRFGTPFIPAQFARTIIPKTSKSAALTDIDARFSLVLHLIHPSVLQFLNVSLLKIVLN